MISILVAWKFRHIDKYNIIEKSVERYEKIMIIIFLKYSSVVLYFSEFYISFQHNYLQKCAKVRFVLLSCQTAHIIYVTYICRYDVKLSHVRGCRSFRSSWLLLVRRSCSILLKPVFLHMAVMEKGRLKERERDTEREWERDRRARRGRREKGRKREKDRQRRSHIRMPACTHTVARGRSACARTHIHTHIYVFSPYARQLN